MRDDFLTADWANHQRGLFATIRNATNSIVAGFDRLLARQFAAPWRHDAARNRVA